MNEKQEDNKKSANQAPLENIILSLASLSISSFLTLLTTIPTTSACIDAYIFKIEDPKSLIKCTTYPTSVFNMSTLNLRPVSSSASLISKPIPSPSLLKPWDFSYNSSPDRKDRNLLIMFHGLGRCKVSREHYRDSQKYMLNNSKLIVRLLGDNKASFFNLAKQLNLPSTAVLSLTALDP